MLERNFKHRRPAQINKIIFKWEYILEGEWDFFPED